MFPGVCGPAERSLSENRGGGGGGGESYQQGGYSRGKGHYRKKPCSQLGTCFPIQLVIKV